MWAVTEMVGQMNATDPDTAFANLILSHVRYLMYSESNSSQPFGIPPDHLLLAQHVTQDTETQNQGHFTNLN